jgi:hypothetical protein
MSRMRSETIFGGLSIIDWSISKLLEASSLVSRARGTCGRFCSSLISPSRRIYGVLHVRGA